MKKYLRTVGKITVFKKIMAKISRILDVILLFFSELMPLNSLLIKIIKATIAIFSKSSRLLNIALIIKENENSSPAAFSIK